MTAGDVLLEVVPESIFKRMILHPIDQTGKRHRESLDLLSLISLYGLQIYVLFLLHGQGADDDGQKIIEHLAPISTACQIFKVVCPVFILLFLLFTHKFALYIPIATKEKTAATIKLRRLIVVLVVSCFICH